jgi:hypothetical protein
LYVCMYVCMIICIYVYMYICMYWHVSMYNYKYVIVEIVITTFSFSVYVCMVCAFNCI